MNEPLVTMCCVCKRVKEDPALLSPAWTDLSGYLHRHHLEGISYRLSHTYCPACLEEQAVALLDTARSRRLRRTRPASPSLGEEPAAAVTEPLLTDRRAS